MTRDGIPTESEMTAVDTAIGKHIKNILQHSSDRPYLSGNTIRSIHYRTKDKGVFITIDPLPYNFAKFKKYGIITSYHNLKTSYAQTVDYSTGGFSGKHLLWVEYTIEKDMFALASSIGGKVVSADLFK
jgi:hypothetical protein